MNEPIVNRSSLLRCLLCADVGFLIGISLISSWPRSTFLDTAFKLADQFEWKLVGEYWIKPPQQPIRINRLRHNRLRHETFADSIAISTGSTVQFMNNEPPNITCLWNHCGRAGHAFYTFMSIAEYKEELQNYLEGKPLRFSFDGDSSDDDYGSLVWDGKEWISDQPS